MLTIKTKTTKVIATELVDNIRYDVEYDTLNDTLKKLTCQVYKNTPQPVEAPEGTIMSDSWSHLGLVTLEDGRSYSNFPRTETNAPVYIAKYDQILTEVETGLLG